jgi:hypothetical protein
MSKKVISTIYLDKEVLKKDAFLKAPTQIEKEKG